MASNQGRHRRVLKELEDIRRNPPLNCSAGPISDSDIFNWRATIMGLKPPFDGGIFSLNLEIPDKYPFEAPKVFQFFVKFNMGFYINYADFLD